MANYIDIYNWMASCTISGLTHIKKTIKIHVFGSNNLINIRVSHSGLDHLVTDFATVLCYFVFTPIRFILYFMSQRDFFSKSSKCGLDHLCMMPSYLNRHIVPNNCTIYDKLSHRTQYFAAYFTSTLQ